jgi:small subunit ribosomal protein S6
MHFDASPQTKHGLYRLLRKDPVVVRATLLKMGDGLKGAVNFTERTVQAPNGPHDADHLWQ